jgi:hypothetical protein
MTVKLRSGISVHIAIILSSLFFLMLIMSGCAQQTAAVKPDAVKPANVSEPPLLPVTLRVDHPQSYTVVPGDNLWDISARFLKDPWRWRDAWKQQTESGMVSELYPGDTIELDQSNAEPQLRLASGERPTIKLSPQVRVEEISRPVPTIRYDVVAPFLKNSMVLPQEDWETQPYILGNAEGNMLTMAGSRLYARGGYFDQPSYRIFRPGGQYRDPAGGGSLGFDMIYVGEVAVEEDGDPAILRLVSTNGEIRPGDRLFPLDDQPPVLNFNPQAAPEDTNGEIIGTLSDNLLISRYSNVVVNLGEADGMAPGTVLAVYQPGRTLADPVVGSQIELPEDRSGLIMLYKVFDLVSYGLVTESTREIRPYDRVGEP